MATLFTEREGGFTAQVSGHQVHNQWIVTYCPLLLKTSMLTTMSNFAVQWNQLNMFVSTSTKGSMPPLSIPEQRINVTKSPTLWSGTVWAQMRLFGDFLASPFIKAILWSCHWRCILKWTMCLFFNWNRRTNSRADKRTPYLLPSFFNCAKMSPLPRKSCTPKYHHISNGTKNTVFGESKNKANMFRDIPASSYYGLGRVYTINPHQQECFYLHLLLHEIQGPTSFKTVNEHTHATYCETCLHRGLLEDDVQWDSVMTEAASMHSARRLWSHCYFTSIMQNIQPKFKEDLS